MSRVSFAHRMKVALCNAVVGTAFLVQGLWTHTLADEPPVPSSESPGRGAPAEAGVPSDLVTCVALTSREPDLTRPGASAGLLLRELARQAVLLAAREDLGLATRDAVLREALPASTDPACLVLDVQTSAVAGENLRVSIHREQENEAKLVIEQELPLSDPIDYRALTRELEAWSAQMLAPKLAELTGGSVPEPRRGSTPPAEAAVSGLEEMNIFSQFSAIRQVHELRRKSGTTAESLGALVRGYAQLALLTQLHWNVVHKDFAARSLLYAARLVRTYGEHSWTLAQRVTSEGLLGLALQGEQETAVEPADGTEGVAGVPALDAVERERLRLARAFSQGDAGGLTPGEGAESLGQLASLLRFLLVENTQCESLLLTSGYRTLEETPECLRVLDAMSLRNGVINSHRTTTYGPTMLARCVVTRLATMPGLPEAVREQIRRSPPRWNDNLLQGVFDTEPTFELALEELPIWQGLVAEGEFPRDQGEPSWQVLGRLHQDMVFLHVARRLDFLILQLGIPVKPYVSTALKAVADYPYAAIVQAYGLDYRRDVFGIWKLLRDTPVVDAHFFLLPVLQRLHNYRLPDAKFLENKWKLVVSHSDAVRWDLEQTTTLRNDPAAAHELRRLFPRSGIAAGQLILFDPGYAQAHQKQWEQEYADSAPVQSALGRRYYETGRMTDAARCFERYVQLSSDEWAYRWLATAYLNLKQPDKWKSTLEACLTKEDYRLSHATIRNDLAQYYIQRGDWESALPYAEAAAATGAGWALLTLASCYEGLERWDDAEQYIRATAERYEASRCDWYYWCCRTGHGDLRAARVLAERWAQTIRPKASSLEDWDLLFRLAILSDEPQTAREPALKGFRMSQNPNFGLYFVLLADEAGDTATRDEVLRDVINRGGRYREPVTKQDRKHTLAFARWMSDALARAAGDNAATGGEAASAPPPAGAVQEAAGKQPLGTEFRLDINALETILKEATPEQRTDIEYFAARFCQRHGTAAQVRDYAERAAQPNVQRFSHVLARVLLRTLPEESSAP